MCESDYKHDGKQRGVGGGERDEDATRRLQSDDASETKKGIDVLHVEPGRHPRDETSCTEVMSYRTNYWTCTCSEAVSCNFCIRVVTKKHYSYEKSRVFFGDAHVNRSTWHVIHDDEVDEAEEHSSHHEECKERIRQHRNIDESRTCF